MRGRLPVLVVLLGLLALAGCTGSDPAPAPSATGSGSSAPTGSASPTLSTPVGPAPFWSGEASYFDPNDAPRQATLTVYPLLRVDGRLLLTVDLRPSTDLAALNYFCISSTCDDLSGISLVDTGSRVRFGPLLDAAGTPVTSRIRLLEQRAGVTYRFGAFYPDPGPAVQALSVDLQYGGAVPGVPIQDGAPFTDLVTDGDGQTQVGQAEPGGVVTWPVPRPPADAREDRHDLVAKVVGGTVNEARGVVSLNADILFAFNSAKLSGSAAGLIAQAATVLVDKADPAKPVKVVGYTDSVGSEDFNDRLSQQRAAAVAAVLKGKVGGLRLEVTGRGKRDPVAANTLPGGADNPAGRALNRRVEIGYSPKPAPAPVVAPSAAASDGSAGAASGPTVDLPARPVKASQVSAVPVSTRVFPLRRDGTLTLVSAELTAEQTRLLSDPFTANGIASRDVGALHVVDPATKKVYVPARDADDPARVLGTYTFGLTRGSPTTLFFYVAELPAGLTSVTVDLGQLGRATGVPVA